MSQKVHRFNMGVINNLMFRTDAVYSAELMGKDSLAKWGAMQRLLTISFNEIIERHGDKLPDGVPRKAARYLVAQHLPEFINHRTYPQTVPGTEGQLFDDARVVRVFGADGQLVAYTHSVNNTSGRFAAAKMRTSPGRRIPMIGGRKYVRVSEVAVDPRFWGNGIGTLALYQTLSLRDPAQPVAGYVYSAEFPHMGPALEEHGMHWTGSKSVAVYGEAGEPTTRVRYAGNGGLLMKHIEALPRASDAIELMHARTIIQ